MTLPSVGPITFDDIRIELGLPVAPISLNDPVVRGLAGIPTGAITLNDFLGKSAVVAYRVTMSVGFKPYAPDEKIATSEIRGFHAAFNYIEPAVGSISPTTTETADNILAIAEVSGGTSAESTRDFYLYVNGHTVNLNFFSEMRILNGTTVQAVFPGGSGIRTTAINSSGSSINVTRWQWSLPSGTARLLPTSGTRFVDFVQ